MKKISEEYISCGNLAAIGKLVKDIREGKERKITFLGASVTKGECVKRDKNFPTVMTRTWCEKMEMEFSPTIVNASMSGTLSGNALFSMNEVLKDKPDLVFLDYSVNDPGYAYLAETFEAVVYRFLKAGIQVVILLFCNHHGKCTKGPMKRIAKYYGVPVVDIGGWIMDQIKAEEFTWDDFALDYVHPNVDGHVMIADALFDFFSFAEKEEPREEKKEIPEEPCFGGVYRDVKYVGDIKYSAKKMSFTETFAQLLVDYTQTPDVSRCSMDIYIDGKYIRTIDYYSEFAWNNRVVHILHEGMENSKHKVDIMPAAQSTCSKEEWEKMNVIFGVGNYPEGW